MGIEVGVCLSPQWENYNKKKIKSSHVMGLDAVAACRSSRDICTC